jgi:hypothetical protein
LKDAVSVAEITEAHQIALQFLREKGYEINGGSLESGIQVAIKSEEYTGTMLNWYFPGESNNKSARLVTYSDSRTNVTQVGFGLVTGGAERRNVELFEVRNEEIVKVDDVVINRDGTIQGHRYPMQQINTALGGTTCAQCVNICNYLYGVIYCSITSAVLCVLICVAFTGPAAIACAILCGVIYSIVCGSSAYLNCGHLCGC